MKEETTVVQTFFNEEFGQFRYIKKDNGEIWFVAIDVCRVLGIKNHRDAVSSLDDDEKDYVGIADAIGRIRQTLIVSEPGLYRLIFMSRKPDAKNFQRLVYHEVLPQIRQTGAYMPKAPVPLTPKEKILAEIKEEMQKPRYKEMFKSMGSLAMDILLFEKYGEDNYEPYVDSVEKITEDGKTYDVIHMGFIVKGIKIF